MVCVFNYFSMQEIVLDMFFELLNIKTPEWFQSFIDGRRLTSKYIYRLWNTLLTLVLIVYRRSRIAPESREKAVPERPHAALKLTDQYIALMVLVFTNTGLLDVCTLLYTYVSLGSSFAPGANSYARRGHDWLQPGAQGYSADG